MSSTHATFPVALRNDQEHVSKTMDTFSWSHWTFFGCLVARGQITTRMDLHALHCCTSPGSYAYQGSPSCMGFLLQPRYAFLWSCTYQEHIPGCKDLPSWFWYKFLASILIRNNFRYPQHFFNRSLLYPWSLILITNNVRILGRAGICD